MNTYTEKEAKALVKFRERLGDLNLENDRNADSYLIKWLRARDLDISKAETMLREHLKWRVENDIDNIIDWEPPKFFTEQFPAEICGYAKNGCPIVIIPCKYADMSQFWKCDPDEHFRNSIRNMELFMKAMKVKSTPENPVTEAIMIYDMEGFDFRYMMNGKNMEMMQEQTKMANDNYPEMIFKAYACFTPKIFTVIFSIFKRFIPKRTISKFEIYGFDKEKWLPSMLELIDIEQLPPRFGGTNYEFERTAFQQCRKRSTRSNASSRRQSHGSHDNGSLEASDEDGFVHVKIPPGKKHQVEYNIEVPNTKLGWIFKTEAYDISFTVLHQESNAQLVPTSRVDSSVKKQVGHINCEKIGKYSLVFDNSYSRMRAKSLHFCVSIDLDSEVAGSFTKFL